MTIANMTSVSLSLLSRSQMCGLHGCSDSQCAFEAPKSIAYAARELPKLMQNIMKRDFGGTVDQFSQDQASAIAINKQDSVYPNLFLLCFLASVKSQHFFLYI